MATKVSITFIDKQGEEEVIKKTFFGIEHMNRWISKQEKELKHLDYVY